MTIKNYLYSIWLGLIDSLEVFSIFLSDEQKYYRYREIIWKKSHYAVRARLTFKRNTGLNLDTIMENYDFISSCTGDSCFEHKQTKKKYRIGNGRLIEIS